MGCQDISTPYLVLSPLALKKNKEPIHEKAENWHLSGRAVFILQPGSDGWGPAVPRAQWNNSGHRKVRGDGSGKGK